MKSLDIRSEPAIRLLAEFLDMDSGGQRVYAEHFAHGELRSSFNWNVFEIIRLYYDGWTQNFLRSYAAATMHTMLYTYFAVVMLPALGHSL